MVVMVGAPALPRTVAVRPRGAMSREDALRRQVEALRHRLSLFSAASLCINASLDFDTVLQAELDNLAKAFTITAELAERHDMHVAISVHPGEYANTSRNYRRIVEQVNSPCLRAK